MVNGKGKILGDLDSVPSFIIDLVTERAQAIELFSALVPPVFIQVG